MANQSLHSAHSFQLDNMVPKTNQVKKYQDWLLVTDTIKSNDKEAKKRMVSEFVPMRELTKEQVNTLAETINGLWSEVIPHVKPYMKPTSEASDQASNDTIMYVNNPPSGMIRDSITTASGTAISSANTDTRSSVENDGKSA